MRSQFRLQSSDQPRHTLGLGPLNAELARELTIDRFDHLPEVAHQPRHSFWQLLVLIGPLRREQPDTMHLVELALQQRVDRRFVAKDHQLCFLAQQLVGEAAVTQVRWR